MAIFCARRKCKIELGEYQLCRIPTTNVSTPPAMRTIHPMTTVRRKALRAPDSGELNALAFAGEEDIEAGGSVAVLQITQLLLQKLIVMIRIMMK